MLADLETRRCGDPCRLVHVGPDVALVGDERRAHVQPDANADRAGFEAGPDRRRCSERSRSGREGDEECVSLRVDLDAAVRGAGARTTRRCSASALA
jgi:hypothetical protein